MDPPPWLYAPLIHANSPGQLIRRRTPSIMEAHRD
jgi:hypothetical protein